MSLTFKRRWLAVCTALALAGCATTPDPEPAPAPIIFPPPPEQARFIYERTLRYSTNLESDESTLDKLRNFATGKPEELKGLVKPYDVAAKHDRVFITDTVLGLVLVFDLANNRYFEFGKEERVALSKPTGIAISEQDEVFVSDVTNSAVIVYTFDGKFIRTIGNSSLLERPSDVAIDSANDRLYVVDTGGVDSPKHGVHVFKASTGEYVQMIGSRGSEPGQFNLPLQADVAPDGTLYVVDGGNFRVQAFSPDGAYKLSIGQLGRYPGQFARPKGIATDNDGNIYVTDTAFGNFQIFNPQGQLLLFIGERNQSSKPAAFMLPAGIEVDENGRVYAADQFFRKVDIFKPALLQTPR